MKIMFVSNLMPHHHFLLLYYFLPAGNHSLLHYQFLPLMLITYKCCKHNDPIIAMQCCLPSFLQFTSCPHIHSPLLFVNCFDPKIIFIITQKQYTCYKNKCTAFYSWFIMLKRKSILQILLPWQRYCHHLIRIL